jgi:hypothetical protein
VTVSRFVAMVLAAVGAAVAGLLTWQLVALWSEGLGAKLQRECVSLVDIVLSYKTISRHEIVVELQQRGIRVPSDPDFSTDRGSDQALAEARYQGLLGKRTPALAKYEAAKQVYEAQWQEIERSPEYEAARAATVARRREEAIRECVLTRAKREGVSIR